MEDEAEVELLEQHLLKTRQISQRMSTILNKFDNRLIKLEKSVQPMHETQVAMAKRGRNIDATLASMGRLGTQQGELGAEENLIGRGPRLEDLRLYTDAIDRLNANIMFGSSDRATKDNARLVELGTKKLVQLYTKLVAEASSGSPPLKLSSPTSTLPFGLMPDRSSLSLQISAPFSPQIVNQLQPIILFLRKLPVPSTHPSHPAGREILRELEGAQSGYAEMRGAWAKKCLEGGGRRAVERVDVASLRGGVEGRGTNSGEEVVEWVRELLAVADAEYQNLGSLSPLPPTLLPSSLPSSFATLLTPLLQLYSTTFQSLLNLIKKDLPKHTFLALSLFSSLQSPAVRDEWDKVVSTRSNGEVNGLNESLMGLRSTCIRSFPEVFVDVMRAAQPPAGAGGEGRDVGTSVAGITLSIIKYLNTLPDVLPAVNACLEAVGDGNWKMGQGAGKVVEKRTGGDDSGSLLESFTHDIVSAMLTTLNTLCKSHRRASLGSIFLLNNVSHLRLHLLGNPSSTIDELLSRQTRELLNSSYRSSKAEYFSSNYTPLIQCLSDDPPTKGSEFGFGSSGKTSLKDKWRVFFEALDELVDRHRVARVMGDDEEGRELLCDEAVRILVPTMERFVGKGKEKEGGRVQKYIKMTPDEVETKLREMYR